MEVGLKRIVKRKRTNKIKELEQNENDENDDEGYFQLHIGIFLDVHGVNELKAEQHGVTKKGYAIMKWWRCTGANNSNTGVPRHRLFPSWGILLKLIALCTPS